MELVANCTSVISHVTFYIVLGWKNVPAFIIFFTEFGRKCYRQQNGGCISWWHGGGSGNCCHLSERCRVVGGLHGVMTIHLNNNSKHSEAVVCEICSHKVTTMAALKISKGQAPGRI